MAVPVNESVMKLFTDLFRFILPDVDPNNTDALSPGELGINYNTGVFYFKDPLTLEIRTPNSVEAVQYIENRYDKVRDEFNADLVGGLHVYTSVTRLPDVTDINTLTIDTMISKMVAPAVLYAHTVTDSYEAVGLPGREGQLSIIKSSENAVVLSFADANNSITYIGQYNGATREFLYWIRDEDTMANYAVASGDGLNQTVTIDKQIDDLFVLTLRLTNDVQPTAVWTVNDLIPSQIYNIDGTTPTTLFKENTIIMLIRDAILDRWILADLDKTIGYQTMKIMDKRLLAYEDGLTVRFQEKVEQLDQVVNSFDGRVVFIENWLTSNAGKFTVTSYVYDCTVDGTVDIPVNNFNVNEDILLVNYNQTILRSAVDYSISADSSKISLLNTTIGAGETIQFIVIKQNNFIITN